VLSPISVFDPSNSHVETRGSVAAGDEKEGEGRRRRSGGAVIVVAGGEGAGGRVEGGGEVEHSSPAIASALQPSPEPAKQESSKHDGNAPFLVTVRG
jgi:hypothetical protein